MDEDWQGIREKIIQTRISPQGESSTSSMLYVIGTVST